MIERTWSVMDTEVIIETGGTSCKPNFAQRTWASGRDPNPGTGQHSKHLGYQSADDRAISD